MNDLHPNASQIHPPVFGDGDAPTRIGMPVVSTRMADHPEEVRPREPSGFALDFSQAAPPPFSGIDPLQLSIAQRAQRPKTVEAVGKSRKRRAGRVARFHEEAEALSGPGPALSGVPGAAPGREEIAGMSGGLVARAIPVAQAIPIREEGTSAQFMPNVSAAEGLPLPQALLEQPQTYATPQAELAGVDLMADDWDEDDFGDEQPTVPMPVEPMPVPPVPMWTGGGGQGSGGHSRLVILLLTLTLLVSLAVVYFTGVADDVLSQVGIPVWSELSDETEDIPRALANTTREAQSAAPKTGEQSGNAFTPVVAPVSATGTPKMTGVTVDPLTARAPATLVFTVYTNEAVTAVQFRDRDLAPLYTSETVQTPSGEGVVWKCMVEFAQPYEGPVRVFLSGGPGQWTDGGYPCQVKIQQ